MSTDDSRANAAAGARREASAPEEAWDLLERAARVQLSRLAPEGDLTVTTAMLDLFRVSNRLLQDLEFNVHREFDLTWAGFRVMFCVQAEPGLLAGELARLAGVSKATVSSVLRTLEGKGFVERVRSSEDARRVQVFLTPEGARIVDQAYLAQHLREQAWLDEIDPPALQGFIEVLRHLLTRDRPSPSVDEGC